jgi:uncharacterized protein YndB with AHSA1/START domain
MRGYDIVEEKVIDASPDFVWEQLISELRGARRWWVPWVTFEQGARPADQVGGEALGTIHAKGVDSKRGPRLKFTARTREVQAPRRLVQDYVAGSFRGSVQFTVDPVNGGDRTRLTIHWLARPAGRVRIMSKIVNIGKEHSKSTRDALNNLAALAHDRWPAPKGAR